MKKVGAALFLVGICSCSALKHDSIGGYYSKLYKSPKYLSVRYDLILNEDSTFCYRIAMQDAKPTCEGLWRYIDANTILLTGDDDANMLSSNYMQGKREWKVEIIGKSKIKIEGNILRRKR